PVHPVLFSNAIPLPAKIALTETDCIAKLAVLVKAEVPLPVMLSLFATVTVPTVSDWLEPKANIAVAPSTVTAPVLNTLLAPYAKVPALTVVVPVCRFVPDKVKVPLPSLAKAPVVLVLAPPIVKFLAPVVILIELLVPAPNVKLRFVEKVGPVYSKVPPLNTKLAAALVDAPILLATPPSVSKTALKIPALILVIPV